MRLYKDGLTMTMTSPSEIAYYKNLGYEEVQEMPIEEPQPAVIVEEPQEAEKPKK